MPQIYHVFPVLKVDNLRYAQVLSVLTHTHLPLKISGGAAGFLTYCILLTQRARLFVFVLLLLFTLPLLKFTFHALFVLDVLLAEALPFAVIDCSFPRLRVE
jgi:hypothetical protein